MEVVYHKNVKHWQEAYDPSIDWHAKWCEKVYTHSTRNEYDFMSMIQMTGNDEGWRREFSYLLYMSILVQEEKERKALAKVNQVIHNCEDDIHSWWVTLNFDPKLFTKEKFGKMIDTLNNKKWYESYEGVIEFHTDNGHKPHFHMKILTSTPIFKKKNKVIDYLVTIIKGLGTRTSVHCEKWTKHCEAYLAGIKKDSKSENVERDEAFRRKNDYLEVYKNHNI